MAAPPQQEIEWGAASEMEVRIFMLSLMSVAVGHVTVDGSVKAARWLMPLGVERRLAEFGAIWLWFDIDLQ